MKSDSLEFMAPTILIVSGDLPLDQTLSAFLKVEGYQIELVENANDAIRKVTENQYDTILWDIDLQETQSFSSIESLTRLDSHLPVIITVTPQTVPQHRDKFLKCGAFDLLIKPYRSPELKVIFQRALVVKRLRGKAERISDKLNTSEEHFKVVVQASPDAIILGDEGGNILSWNGAAQNMFGYTSEEIIGQPLTLLMPSRYRQAHQEGIARVRSTHQTKVIGKTVELVGLRKGGREFPLQLSLSFSFVENKTFYCGIIRDLTPHKEAEKALQESEDRFKLTMEQINEAVFFGDL